MNTIKRNQPVRAKHFVKRENLPTNANSNIGDVEDITDNRFLLSPSAAAFSTFDGFFGEKNDKDKPCLLYELCTAYAEIFLETSQYLWGPSSTASLMKAIQELQALKDYDMEENKENKKDEHQEKDEEQQNKNQDNKLEINKDKHIKQLLQQTSEQLFLELENRETILHKILMGNLLTMGE